jgi:hypothetical protein
MVAHQTVVLQSRVQIRRLPSPQLTANLLVGCHLGMALGCGLTSVRGNRGENYENEPLVRQKHTKKKKLIAGCCLAQMSIVVVFILGLNLSSACGEHKVT